MALVWATLIGVGLQRIFIGLTRPPRPLRRDEGERRVDRLTAFLARAGAPGVSPPAFAGVSLALAVAAFAFTQALLGLLSVSAIAFVAGLGGLGLYYLRREAHRHGEVQKGLVDATTQLRDSLRAGMSLSEGLAGLAKTGPPALRRDCAALAQEWWLLDPERALKNWQGALNDPLADQVAATLRVAARTGGEGIGEVLEDLAESTRGEHRLQEELRARRAGTVTQARIIAAVPLALLVAIRRIQPDYLSVFAGLGQLWLALCVVSIGFGYWLMLRLTRPGGDERILVSR